MIETEVTSAHHQLGDPDLLLFARDAQLAAKKCDMRLTGVYVDHPAQLVLVDLRLARDLLEERLLVSNRPRHSISSSDRWRGSLSVTKESWFGIPASQHWYDITAANAAADGYVTVQPEDDAGLRACAASLKCFIPVGFDWRLSAEDNAHAVLTVINRVLSDTGADRVDILAHSQGGLIANALVHESDAKGKIYRIVSLGTPYLGAPKLLSELLFAEPCQFQVTKAGITRCIIDPGLVQGLLQNFPGALELAPSAAYDQAYKGGGAVVESDGTGTTALGFPASMQAIDAMLEDPPAGTALQPENGAMLAAAEQMHTNDDAWSPLDTSVGLLRMIGYDAGDGQCSTSPCSMTSVNASGTLLSVDLTPDPSDGDHVPSSLWGSGDGTVPLLSAALYNPAAGFDERGGAHNEYWCGVSHLGLAQVTAVWTAAEAYFEGTMTPQSDTVGQRCPGGGLGSVGALGLVS